MPTYGSQLLAQRNPVDYIEPDLRGVYAGYDARSKRHDDTIQGYSQYVDNVVKDQTLDPVEKQRRLDELKSNVYGMYSKYNGNISDARDEVIDAIVDNRKDPYWAADRARTAGYNNMQNVSSQLAAQGLSTLYQDSQGNYINDINSVYGSLTDEYGKYKPLTSYDVRATKQLNYEVPFHDMFKTIKANISSMDPTAQLSEGTMANLIKGYFTTGKFASPNQNINRVLKDSVDRYMMTPEWAQLKGRYGQDAYKIASDLASSVSNQYRYSQDEKKYDAINYTADELKGKGSSSNIPLWDRRKQTLDKTSEQFSISDFIDPKTGNLKTEKDYPVNPVENITTNLNTSGFTNQPIGMQVDSNVLRRKKLDDLSKVKSQLKLIRQINPNMQNMSDADIASFSNNNLLNSGYGDIIHSFPNSAITTLGGEDLFNDYDSKNDVYGNRWKDNKVYYKDGDSWKLAKEQSGDFGDWDKQELAKEVYRDSPKSDLIFAKDSKGNSLGAGYYASNGSGLSVFIPAPAKIQEYLKPLEKLEDAERNLSSLEAKSNYNVIPGVGGNNAVVIRTSDGLKIIEAPFTKTTAEKAIEDYEKNGKYSDEFYASLANHYPSYTIDEYNNYLKTRLIPREKVGDSKEE